ncbi:hypothetical protein FOA43_003529 [Brettanomyces nanus]|uniref:methionyl-tRNA formyltransferase n=1 Tax=Eeniella nana TaxID=13502 RepID=A0A875S5E1_EENNA|nr:uncharacterized protein FOA43_003529 [Brettanomyces nanus]QPG76143.1 hypothetical protein FOA43_003529 [Brettanomyces nanus]
MTASKLLRIGYFGSDYFSINCLKQILPLRFGQPQIISRLDVITRDPKPSGKGLRHLKDVPVARFAEENQLRVLRAEKEVDFDALLANQYDLCIAVSYGLLIPASFINSLPFGGLNIHPSLLPKYSGAAPLQRALLNEDSTTGVTIQTLHPTEFDKGDILSRQEYEVRPDETFESLTKVLSQAGGLLLKNIIEKQMYDRLSPDYHALKSELLFSYAKKIQSHERHIDWAHYSSFNLKRRSNTLGPLYTFKRIHLGKAREETGYRRVVLNDFKESPQQQLPSLLVPGCYDLDLTNPNRLLVKTVDGTLSVGHLNVEGLGSLTGEKMVRSSKKMFGNIEKRFLRNQNIT